MYINNLYISVQTQLRTGKYKPATYFIKFLKTKPENVNDENIIKIYDNFDFNNIELNYILKIYPYNDDFENSEINRLIISNDYKIKLGLISIYPNIIYKDDEKIIVLFENYNKNIDFNNYIIQSSKIEEKVKIYQGDKKHINLDNCEINLSLFKVLAFRIIIKTNDTCISNILYINDYGYISIDDPAFCKTSPLSIFKKSLKKEQQIRFINGLNKYWNEIYNVLTIWKNICPELGNRINYLMIKDNWKF
jgi:hypothetical protein